MIKTKNLGEMIKDCYQVGNASAVRFFEFLAPFDGEIFRYDEKSKTAGAASGSMITDIKINNVSIFTTAGNRPTMEVGVATAVTGAIDGVRTFSAGDLISIEHTAVHGTPAVDTVGRLVLAQQRNASNTDFSRIASS